MERLSDGFIVFCKRECATCAMVVPVIKELRESDQELTIYTQDGPSFPDGIRVYTPKAATRETPWAEAQVGSLTEKWRFYDGWRGVFKPTKKLI